MALNLLLLSFYSGVAFTVRLIIRGGGGGETTRKKERKMESVFSSQMKHIFPGPEIAPTPRAPEGTRIPRPCQACHGTRLLGRAPSHATPLSSPLSCDRAHEIYSTAGNDITGVKVLSGRQRRPSLPSLTPSDPPPPFGIENVLDLGSPEPKRDRTFLFEMV